jgi:hypothetical protein
MSRPQGYRTDLPAVYGKQRRKEDREKASEETGALGKIRWSSANEVKEVNLRVVAEFEILEVP